MVWLGRTSSSCPREKRLVTSGMATARLPPAASLNSWSGSMSAVPSPSRRFCSPHSGSEAARYCFVSHSCTHWWKSAEATMEASTVSSRELP